jgi:hypothetical protein
MVGFGISDPSGRFELDGFAEGIRGRWSARTSTRVRRADLSARAATFRAARAGMVLNQARTRRKALLTTPGTGCGESAPRFEVAAGKAQAAQEAAAAAIEFKDLDRVARHAAVRRCACWSPVGLSCVDAVTALDAGKSHCS